MLASLTHAGLAEWPLAPTRKATSRQRGLEALRHAPLARLKRRYGGVRGVGRSNEAIVSMVLRPQAWHQAHVGGNSGHPLTLGAPGPGSELFEVSGHRTTSRNRGCSIKSAAILSTSCREARRANSTVTVSVVTALSRSVGFGYTVLDEYSISATWFRHDVFGPIIGGLPLQSACSRTTVASTPVKNAGVPPGPRFALNAAAEHSSPKVFPAVPSSPRSDGAATITTTTPTSAARSAIRPFAPPLTPSVCHRRRSSSAVSGPPRRVDLWRH